MGVRGIIVAIIFAMLAFFIIGNAKAQPFDANGNGTQIIGGRPSGCPFRYCGCALARFLGISDRRLNLAWNWAKLFPRTDARAGAAAVRRGHVMLLVAQVSPSDWLVRDYNSGRGLSRIHVRSVRGFVFVDPSSRHAGLNAAP
jgi:hypothetical protein